MRSAARRLLPDWLKRVGAACAGCFTPAAADTEQNTANNVAAPGAAKPDGLAAVARDFPAPPMLVVVPRSTWSAAAAAAAAATQMASRGEASSSQPPEVAESTETGSASPPPSLIADDGASPLETQLPEANPCRALMAYSPTVHLQQRHESSTRVPSGGRGSAVLTVQLMIDVSLFPRAASIPIPALRQFATSPRLAARDIDAVSGANPRPLPSSRLAPTPSAPRCIYPGTVNGGAASAGTPHKACTALITYPVRNVVYAGSSPPLTVAGQCTDPFPAFPLCQLQYWRLHIETACVYISSAVLSVCVERSYFQFTSSRKTPL